MISEFMECESQVIELCWTFLYKKVIRQYPSYNCLFQQLNGNCIHCTELHQSACLECAGWMFPQTRIINVCCVWWLILCHNTNHWIGNTHGHIIVGLQGHEAWCRDHLLMMIQEKVCSLLVNEVSFQFYNRKYVDMCRETTSASLNLNILDAVVCPVCFWPLIGDDLDKVHKVWSQWLIWSALHYSNAVTVCTFHFLSV